MRPEKSGAVTYVDGQRIKVDEREYPLRKFVGLNERTCLNQKPIVKLGQRGQPAHDGVEVALDVAVAHHGKLPLRVGGRLPADLGVLLDREEVDGRRRRSGGEARDRAEARGEERRTEPTTTMCLEHDDDPLEPDAGLFETRRRHLD